MPCLPEIYISKTFFYFWGFLDSLRLECTSKIHPLESTVSGVSTQNGSSV
uniref:Uncharacterized protein n=1 Tax=Anguilla anguilla TaxID=7936 RepID=A0A0E9WYA2_ANGAN